jgi:UDP-N-acetylmuramoyl-L-alanyl-D-glutamate--2,6-diaminopimelate ligase
MTSGALKICHNKQLVLSNAAKYAPMQKNSFTCRYIRNSTMQFAELLRGADILGRTASNPAISDVVYDSRKMIPGALFIAMQGGATDGNRYVESALQQGAVAIVTDSEETWIKLRAVRPDIAIARVKHGRMALAQVSANFFSHPESRLHLSGVTGTNGKTTTTYLLESMLRTAGRSCVLVGTIEYHVAQEVRSSPHTTPESRDLFQLFADGVAAGATEAVMEVSSHALDQGRVWGLHWDTAVFTNLTQDHLDYHGDMETYFQAKAKMFTGTGAAPPRVAAIHAADDYGQRIVALARAAGSEVVTYGLEQGDFHAMDIQLAAQSTRFRLVTPGGETDLHTHLAGPVNVLNLLAASAAAMARGLTLEEIARGVENIDSVPGRFQTVSCGQPFTVVIDYAHTDDALRNVTRLARLLASPRNGHVITVFGCGGDRDRTKRPRMGRAAGEGSDFVVATSDNPRSEEPTAILAEILPGLEAGGARFTVEPDRARAIRLAIAEAHDNDVVVIAGKGHEKMQILRDRTIPFDDAEQARQALFERFSTAGGIAVSHPGRQEHDDMGHPN